MVNDERPRGALTWELRDHRRRRTIAEGDTDESYLVCRVPDSHGSKLAEYLSPQSSDTDREIDTLIKEAIRELTYGAAVDSADIARDDEGDDDGPGSGSESD